MPQKLARLIPCSRQSSKILSPLQDAMICAALYRPLFMLNLLRYLAEKILLPHTPKFRGDYRRTGKSLASVRSFVTKGCVVSDYSHLFA